MQILHDLQHDTNIRIIIFSQVADPSFDLSAANVLTQLSTHGGSRRQPAQRLGRIVPSKRMLIFKNRIVFFYSLVSQDTVHNVLFD
ncbi:unnamed protein product [Rotaria sp. Silwood1]|nr:unnamed protein product [Rotaria sp. Silwood1]CAF3733411.1 unnamed protein product [Rotaria sp. Silwood1]CAF3922284.1 unnamed protein product [Rotaria sp. Silwood1]CAF3965685.1 unnamed protein product [Rotaria sp. Silwood1]CAF4879363.1 unnamed protein product [Rotaria sp. Silwood1]